MEVNDICQKSEKYVPNLGQINHISCILSLKRRRFQIIKRARQPNTDQSLNLNWWSEALLRNWTFNHISLQKNPRFFQEKMGGGDARNWDEDGYRNSILKEREIQTRTVFRTVFAPSQNPNPDAIVVASSDGSVSSYSISDCISSLVSPSLSLCNKLCTDESDRLNSYGNLNRNRVICFFNWPINWILR